MRLLIAMAAAVVALHTLTAHAASVDGINVHWTSHGAGPRTIILVHDWMSDETSWSEQVPALSRSYRVITLELPGHGRSGTPAAFSIELLVRAVEAVRSEAKAERVVLAGHGTGTAVIRKYTLMYPDRVSGLVLANGWIQIADGSKGPGPASVSDSASRTSEQRLRDSGYFSELTSPEMQQRILKMTRAVPQATYVDGVLAMNDRSQWTNDPVRVPVLAIYTVRPYVATEGAVKILYPTAEFHRIPETGHWLMMEAPEVFNRLIEGFLARIAF